ncbi:MAG: peroxide stress protein YaaA [Rhodospirillaceae bacterium]|nr:peroxide stress protein YaaA [Rhodospirillaceae bacterium]
MLALLSPAKKLDFGPTPAFVKPTTPVLAKDTALLAARAKKLTREDLRRLMDISPKLADLNYQRFQSFDVTGGGESKPAIYAFNGDVYMGFQAKTLDKDDIAFAQKHVAILSGLYGLLRPLDAIQPYRLEMGSRVDTARGKDLYAFWRENLTAHINGVTAKMKAPTVINLASGEYWGAVDENALKAPVIHAAFKEIKNGKATIVSFLAKKARGMMARYIVQHRLTAPEEIKAFDADGYAFDAKASTKTTWVFSRKAR